MARWKRISRLFKTGSLLLRGVVTIFAITIALAMITANECHAALSSKFAEAPFPPSLLYGAVLWIWWGFIAASMWLSAKRWPWLFTFSAKSFFLHGAFSSALALAHLNLLQEAIRYGSRYSHAWNVTYSSVNYLYLARFGFDLLLYGFIFGIFGFLHMQSQAQRDALRSLELEKQLSQAQLHALQMQLEPHFLFNTLNAVTTLVELHRNEEAAQTLAHLNTILRTTLQRKTPEKVPFAQELQIIESYLAIQQVRFADRLSVKIETSPDALEGLVPCFLLQPIIENAIRHGISHRESDGMIETRVERVGERLQLRVRDNGPGIKGPQNGSKGHGIGTRNTRERLSYFYPNAHEYTAREPENGGYEVTILIPYERQTA